MGPEFQPKMLVKSLSDEQIVRLHQLFRQAKFDDPSGQVILGLVGLPILNSVCSRKFR